MGELNLSRLEIDAITAIQPDDLDRKLEECFQDGDTQRLHTLGLLRCGPYLSTQLRAFERALSEFMHAKAPRKLEETEERARRAASNLEHAVLQMKHRAETEQKEEQLFHVDDNIIPPSYLTEQLSVDIGYRWRPAPDAQWIFGHLTITHRAQLEPDFALTGTRRNAKREQDRHDQLYREWEHLMRVSLHSLKEFFREGGDGAQVPKTFQARVDSHTRRLNNHSAQFWSEQPDNPKGQP
ncbi:hypothetical protein ACSVIJ_05265 [Pseudomonas sp. NCHU5208]|uniref:hypothetical protein n=1 Tax=unclassified Pseudomonas TaxID=196821 RepID=UPI003F951960